MHVTGLTVILLLLCEPIAFARDFKHFVLEVLESGALVKLDDGFIWDVPQDSFLGQIIHDYQGEAKTWLSGDEVTLDLIDIGDRTPRIVFKLKNQRTLNSVSVKFRKQNENWVSPFIHILESKGRYITLSDGTRWEIGDVEKWRSSANWGIGERIAVYHSSSYEDFVLFNPDYAAKRSWLGLPTPYHHSCVYASKVDL